MSESVEIFRAMDQMRKREREVFGVPCPVCRQKLPKAHPKILKPGQLCRAHKPHFRDPRPEPTAAEWTAAMNGEVAQ